MKTKSCLIQIFVSDFKKAEDWYQKMLGTQLKNKSDEWKSISMELTGVVFDICQPIPKWGTNWVKVKKLIGGLKGIFFYVDDINSTYKELKTKGVEFLKPPFKTPWGEYKANFIDPDGNEFSLVQK